MKEYLELSLLSLIASENNEPSRPDNCDDPILKCRIATIMRNADAQTELYQLI
jgi:hypothetical protein